MKRIAIIGGTGNGLVVAQIILDLVEAGHKYQLLGFLNDHLEKGDIIEQWPVLGTSEEWSSLPDDVLFVQAILSVGKMKPRATKLQALGIPQQRWATVIHPSANIGFNCRIGHGVAICAHVTVQPGVVIGDNCMIRAGANVGHDVQLADYVDVGPNTTLCGYAKVGKGVQVAPNAVVRDNIIIGEYATVAAGAAVFKEVAAESTVLGNPARRIR